MTLFLYIAVDFAEASPISLPSIMAQAAAPGYSIYEKWEGEVGFPDESAEPLRTTLYAHNYFRVSVADHAVVFGQEATPPSHIVDANKRLLAALIDSPRFRIRRWLYTLQGWDDEDQPFVRVLDEGVGPGRIEVAVANFTSPLDSHWAGESGG